MGENPLIIMYCKRSGQFYTCFINLIHMELHGSKIDTYCMNIMRHFLTYVCFIYLLKHHDVISYVMIVVNGKIKI